MDFPGRAQAFLRHDAVAHPQPDLDIGELVVGEMVRRGLPPGAAPLTLAVGCDRQVLRLLLLDRPRQPVP